MREVQKAITSADVIITEIAVRNAKIKSTREAIESYKERGITNHFDLDSDIKTFEREKTFLKSELLKCAGVIINNVDKL